MPPKAYPQAPLVLMMLLHMDITAASTHEVAPAIGMAVSVWQIACASQQAFRQAGEEWLQITSTGRASTWTCDAGMHASWQSLDTQRTTMPDWHQMQTHGQRTQSASRALHGKGSVSTHLECWLLFGSRQPQRCWLQKPVQRSINITTLAPLNRRSNRLQVTLNSLSVL